MYYNEVHQLSSNMDDNMSIVSESTCTVGSRTNSVKKNQKRITDEEKRSDKGYLCFRVKPTKNVGIRTTKVEMFDSGNCVGNRMRDPISGTRMMDRVGSKSEYNYFKVRICGIKSKTPVTLFYDSPEQYERHHKCVVCSVIKEKWHQDKFLRESSKN
jgi:hypothetical protein